MVRTLAFDYPTALEHATRAFWRAGYAGTSLRDLLAAMGIGEGSFYNTMKSKKRAYLESLKHYNATVTRAREEAFAAAPTAALGMRAFFRVMLESLDDPETPRVCLMAGSLSPDVLTDAELGGYVRDQYADWTRQLIERFAADRRGGLLPESFVPEGIAPVIVTFIQGFWRTALLPHERGSLERQVDAFLTALGL